jgi:ethanolamine utilization protein EutA
VLVVLDADVANIVGRLLREEFGVRAPIVCIDEVELREFDYVDLGALLPDQNVVPLVVKSLVFR